MTTPPPAPPADEPIAPQGWFTAKCARLAESVHAWVRFAAILTAISGVLLFLVVLLAVFMGSAAAPQLRGLIGAVGSLYIVIALAMLCMSFMLFRYSEKLAIAAKQKRAMALVEGAPYETAYWATAAALAAGWLLAMVLSAGAGNAKNVGAVGAPRDTAALDFEKTLVLNVVATSFCAGGAALILLALQPPKRES